MIRQFKCFNQAERIMECIEQFFFLYDTSVINIDEKAVVNFYNPSFSFAAWGTLLTTSILLLAAVNWNLQWKNSCPTSQKKCMNLFNEKKPSTPVARARRLVTRKNKKKTKKKFVSSHTHSLSHFPYSFHLGTNKKLTTLKISSNTSYFCGPIILFVSAIIIGSRMITHTGSTSSHSTYAVFAILIKFFWLLLLLLHKLTHTKDHRTASKQHSQVAIQKRIISQSKSIHTLPPSL